MEENRISYSELETRAFNQKAVLSPKKQQKPAVFGQKAPANPMFVPGTYKQQKPAQKKQQSPAAQKKQQKQQKQQKPAQRKPQFGQKAQAKPAPAMRFA